MASKINFSVQAQDWCTRLAQLFKEAPDLEHVYFDEGYHSAGSDAIIDADLTSLGIKAADVSAFIVVAQQLQKFDVGNIADPVTTASYGESINAMRTDL